MITSVQGDIYAVGTAAYADIALDGTNIYAVTAQTGFHVFNQQTLTNTLTFFASSLTGTGIALANSSSSILTYSSANVYFVENSTGYFSNITSGAAATFYSAAMQQVDCDTTTGQAIATQSTTGNVTLINTLTFTCSSLVIGGLSGQNATCVTAKRDGTGNFLIGTTNGLVIEINAAGSTIKTLTLPQTNRYGGALTSYRVASISYYSGKALIMDTAGVIRLYDWTQSTPALLDLFIGTCWNLNQNSVLSRAASGTCFLTGPKGTGLYTQALTELYFEQGEILVESQWLNFPTATVMRGVAHSPVSNKAVVVSTDTNSLYAMKVLNVTPTVKVGGYTRIQFPANTDVSGRIIRMRDAGIGRSIVELDVTISAGATSLPATMGRNYIETALLTSPSSLFDIREFKA